MLRIRFHGRGGQGIKTASQILGSAFFREGFQVQDAPLYGAERRGAPVFAYVRAAREPIHERGAISRPNLVLIADETLVGVPAAGVLRGVDSHTTLVLHSEESADTWRERLNLSCALHVLPSAGPGGGTDADFVGAACVGAAARLLGVISWQSVAGAIAEELSFLDPALMERNQQAARYGFDLLEKHAGTVTETAEARSDAYTPPAWLEIPFDDASVSAPVIHAAATSVEAKTGLWRTMRPVIDYERCHGCWWVCSTLCPDSAIEVNAGSPRIDYDHCKGCLVCVAVCPHHAIEAVPEHARPGEGAP